MERKGYYKSRSFPQRICDFFDGSNGLLADRALCLASGADGTVYIGTENGLNYSKSDGGFGSLACGCVQAINAADDGTIYFASGKIVFCVKNGKICELQILDEDVVAIKGKKDIYLITESTLYKLGNPCFEPYFETDRPAMGLACSKGKIVSFSGRCLAIFAGKRKHWMCVYPEHTTMPEFKINTAAFDESLGFLWLGTDKGAYIFDNGCGWYGHNEINCLPNEEINSISFADDGRVILGSEAGLTIISNGAAKHLPATRWACAENINDAIAVGSDVWTATDSGVTKISEKTMTLAEKADYCFELTEKYYIRKPGYATHLGNIANCDISTGKPKITDNDGLWTHTYLAALCYCYAVTKDEKVLEAARRSMKACAYLTKVSGIKGFTARAVRFEDDEGYGIGTEQNVDWCEWHKAPDGTCEWLGETSSDEMTGHFLGFSLYYDLCADNEEKAYIREIITDIADHIIDNGYRLCDIDGLPTTWACWAPSELNGKSMWLWEKCVNSLEILTFLDVAYHMSGDEKYRKEFMRLAIDEHYLINAAQHKKDDARITHIDDNLAFLCSSTILRIEKDSAIRKYLLMGMKHHWDYERTEHCVMWNLIYGAFTDEVCDIDETVKALRDMPIDFINRKIYNAKRKDLVFDTAQEHWGGEKQLIIPLALDEKPMFNYDSNPYIFEGGDNKTAICPSCYLLPYWFGRYYGLIDEGE